MVNRRAARRAAACPPSAPSVPPLIAALDLPAELCSILRLQYDCNRASYISMTYANLSAYYNIHPTILMPPVPSRHQYYPRPTVHIDATIPTQLSRDGLDILPYIYLHTHYPHIHFVIHTSESEFQCNFHTFLIRHVQNKVDAWAEFLSQGSVQQVRLYYRYERTVDIVLKPGSKWANEWQRGVVSGRHECEESLEMKKKLGLTGIFHVWVAYFVVGSMEG
ncbi:hypothetical protein TUN199_06234 [Pyrenophora tritici-repentis]|nr:hypothetical protein TUN205_08363 [Pyrenophora tritici-repentis]KAI0621774.1 hypothetical protein TUN199_06234 [Pyrenophora tritici-repentis]